MQIDLTEHPWILSDSDSEAIFKSGDWYEWLLDNGIFNEKDSELWFLNARYEQYGDGWGGKCPYCKKEVRFYELSGDPIRLKCKNCGTKLSATSRTWISGNKLPLAYWRRAAWLLGQGLEISSNWLAEHLGVTQKTAYWMLCTMAEATKTRPVKTSLRVNLDAHGIEKSLLETADAPVIDADLAVTEELKVPLPDNQPKLTEQEPSKPDDGTRPEPPFEVESPVFEREELQPGEETDEQMLARLSAEE